LGSRRSSKTRQPENDREMEETREMMNVLEILVKTPHKHKYEKFKKFENDLR
jgi:hypothetical protein